MEPPQQLRFKSTNNAPLTRFARDSSKAKGNFRTRYLHRYIKLHLEWLESVLLATRARSGIRRTATHGTESDKVTVLILCEDLEG
ncbi:hypothetical protein ACS79_20240 [Vibrio lentus]|nr:hypothetical protein ACS79_20240 [Vibrio lentus]